MNETQKYLALFFCIFLFFIYKTTVLDPYLYSKSEGSFSELSKKGEAIQTTFPSEQKAQSVHSDRTSGTETVPVSPPSTDSTSQGVQRSQIQQSGKYTSTLSTVSSQSGNQQKLQYPTDKEVHDAGDLSIHTDLYTARISFLGGRVSEFQLNNYRAQINSDSPLLNLVQHQANNPFPGAVYSGTSEDSWVKYRLSPFTCLPTDNEALSQGSRFVLLSDELGPDNIPDSSCIEASMLNQTKTRFVSQEGNVFLSEKETVKLEFVGELPDGRTIVKTYSFTAGNYVLTVKVELSAPANDKSHLKLEWTRFVTHGPAKHLDPYEFSGFVWFNGEAASRETFVDFSEKTENLQSEERKLENVLWVSLSDNYFTASILSPSHLAPAGLIKTGDLYRAWLSGGEKDGSFLLYLGPNSYRLLEQYGYNLSRNINFGHLGFISGPLLMFLRWFYDLLGNYGLAIICLTIFVKLAVYPLATTSFKQMKAMQELQPEVQRIRESAQDKQGQQMELLELYKKRGVNPMGGCFPLLIQMPIFIGLYSALMLSVELRHAPFALWVKDLSAPERLTVGNIGLPVFGVLFVISMLVQQWTTPSTLDKAQRIVMTIMPVVIFGFMFISLPAGLTIYWLTNNLISIGQQRALLHGGTKQALGVTLLISLLVFALAFSMVKVGIR